MAKNSLALPDSLVQLLSAADKARGFPAGTMASIMSQEIGGRPDILAKPDTYHYAAGPDGRRVAKHTGKVSTAFGPFGILESTAKDPGYGVTPLKDKSIEEQVRFASEYLDARAKSAGSLQAGIAGYGEGAKYSNQVARRIQGKTSNMVVSDDVVAVAPAPVAQAAPVQVAQVAAPVQQAQTSAVTGPVAPVMPDYAQDPWQEFLRTRFSPEGTTAGLVVPASEPVKPKPQAMPLNDDFAQLASMDVSTRPNFGVFQGLARLGARRSS